ncbi:MAG: sulfurtransferase complex subunit TusC [Candidatus Rokubacteria bacterium]|nr:sulfurtransferase complex subunit TusC [Candidatus Rokubacteria bacterium]
MEAVEPSEHGPQVGGAGEVAPPRKVLVLMRKAPYGSLYNWEGLQTLLIMGAYKMQGKVDVAVAFVDDGVYAITQGQDPRLLGVKALAKTYPALPDFEIERFYVDEQSLADRNLTLNDLVIKPELLDGAGMARLLEQQDAVLPF